MILGKDSNLFTPGWQLVDAGVSIMHQHAMPSGYMWKIAETLNGTDYTLALHTETREKEIPVGNGKQLVK